MLGPKTREKTYTTVGTMALVACIEEILHPLKPIRGSGDRRSNEFDALLGQPGDLRIPKPSSGSRRHVGLRCEVHSRVTPDKTSHQFRPR